MITIRFGGLQIYSLNKTRRSTFIAFIPDFVLIMIFDP